MINRKNILHRDQNHSNAIKVWYFLVFKFVIFFCYLDLLLSTKSLARKSLHFPQQSFSLLFFFFASSKLMNTRKCYQTKQKQKKKITYFVGFHNSEIIYLFAQNHKIKQTWEVNILYMHRSWRIIYSVFFVLWQSFWKSG